MLSYIIWSQKAADTQFALKAQAGHATAGGSRGVRRPGLAEREASQDSTWAGPAPHLPGQISGSLRNLLFFKKKKTSLPHVILIIHRLVCQGRYRK